METSLSVRFAVRVALKSLGERPAFSKSDQAARKQAQVYFTYENARSRNPAV